eukprot:SAG31_NODE_22892_length_516_cov_0.573141_1_plen_29_part_10
MFAAVSSWAVLAHWLLADFIKPFRIGTTR